MSERNADKQAAAPWQVPVAFEYVAETGLAKATRDIRRAAEPVQQQHQMQHNQVEPPLDRIRNPVIGVKWHRTGLRHDGAIEGMDCAGLGIAPKPR